MQKMMYKGYEITFYNYRYRITGLTDVFNELQEAKDHIDNIKK